MNTRWSTRARATLNTIDETLASGAYRLSEEALRDEDSLLQNVDAHAWLHLMWRRWGEVFQDKLGHVGRSYVSEMIEARNNWAHQKAFTNDEAYRVADTAARLLKAVGAANEALAAEEVGRELLRLRYDEEARKSKKATGQLGQEQGTTTPGLKPWREVVQPHPDVASGRYLQAQFAADLAGWVRG